jgi:UDP-N-acetylglucosamine--N-acetylmuramyl-(pentapeptide) pyrophosphoryl-undecaprenol N-acetylglucosamine transferase
MAAIKLKMKTIIHEQNAILGLANFLVYKKVDRLLLGLPLAKPINGDNIKLLGNPRITEIYENNKNWIENDKLILVVGGSRGSQVINDCTIKAKDELINKGYRIILVTGKKYFEENKNTLPASTENFTIIPFTNHLIEFMRKSSIVVSRSGATTLSEILGLRKIAILIPSPNVTKNHQEKNADVLVNSGASIKIVEHHLNPKILIDNIDELTFNRLKRINMIENMIKIAEISARDKFIKEMEMII